MANTTNFGWETPDDTDLVKDGAAAMRTLGNAIDTSFVDLKGGTTGQILSKASNTDLDYTWINNDQGDITAVTAGTGLTGGGTSGAITLTNDMATVITAAGDIVIGTGSGTYDNLPIGTTGQILTADTTVSPYKVKWAAAAGGGKNWSLLNAGGTALTGSATITVSGISAKDDLLIVFTGASSANVSSFFSIRFNSVSTNYDYVQTDISGDSTYSASLFSTNNMFGDSSISLGRMSGSATSVINGFLFVSGCNNSGLKAYHGAAAATAAGSNNQRSNVSGGTWNNSATVSSISLISSTGNFDAGTLYVYGA